MSSFYNVLKQKRRSLWWFTKYFSPIRGWKLKSEEPRCTSQNSSPTRWSSFNTDFSKDKILHGIYKAPACPPSSIMLAMELLRGILAMTIIQSSTQRLQGQRKKMDVQWTSMGVHNSEMLISPAALKTPPDLFLHHPQQPVLSLWTAATPLVSLVRNGRTGLCQYSSGKGAFGQNQCLSFFKEKNTSS